MDQPEIDHDAPTPVYRQIAALIIADIERNALAADRKIPSESALTQRFGVARETARNAVRYLREEGWVYTVPQRGTYVAARGSSEPRPAEVHRRDGA
ncbi:MULTISPECIES: GntR family transcriptional regulator [Kitasatospora]|uniref:GntR family transcriptional regulator n=1 Tax=Kitasatospora TaxID=2063 RepID=UPI00093A25DA|nr:winged helix-turn-helix domain-containing protein [Kitasatospora sp. CB01950]OKJ15960.1 GntR family transcriptional regulator [Kitasatospora sp. CB01950]